MNHTPGPWGISKAGINRLGAWLYVIGNGDDLIAQQAIEADARLIAAAPDLLAALEYLEAVLSEQSEETFERELIRIRSAIAKAEGRT